MRNFVWMKSCAMDDNEAIFYVGLTKIAMTNTVRPEANYLKVLNKNSNSKYKQTH